MQIPPSNVLVSLVGNQLAQSRSGDAEKLAVATSDRAKAPAGHTTDSLESIAANSNTDDRGGDGHGYEADRQVKPPATSSNETLATLARTPLIDGSGQLLDLDA